MAAADRTATAPYTASQGTALGRSGHVHITATTPGPSGPVAARSRASSGTSSSRRTRPPRLRVGADHGPTIRPSTCGSDAQLFAGRYQARAVPIADTAAGTALQNTVALVPGTYGFVARAAGHGLVRIGPVTVSAGQQLNLAVTMPTNPASGTAGATATGSGTSPSVGL